jgi:DNA-binding GntR family transcriptional regulator
MAKATTLPPGSSAALGTLPKGSGSQRAYEILKHRILALDLAPGTHLEESRLAAEIGISRTPIREALIRLSSERLVELFANRSSMVASLDLQDIQSYFEALSFSQATVTQLAAERRNAADLERVRHGMTEFENAATRRDSDEMIVANRDFHLSIAAAARNNVLIDFCTTLYNQGMRVSRMAVSLDFDRQMSLSDHLDRIVAEHREMVELIDKRAGDEAAQLARRHTALAHRRVLLAISSCSSGAF